MLIWFQKEIFYLKKLYFIYMEFHIENLCLIFKYDLETFFGQIFAT